MWLINLRSSIYFSGAKKVGTSEIQPQFGIKNKYVCMARVNVQLFVIWMLPQLYLNIQKTKPGQKVLILDLYEQWRFNNKCNFEANKENVNSHLVI